ncbi:polyprenyl synthetase family protein [Sinomonas susongensis]|uniref:polyprenyl synthetase family protein n=1 Tax=Sinomonas susongensis TaxID=1324851 RepID=UPI001108F3E4|nr:polyprenyl synthetase family protein [Sinomonas susongensis]
MSGTAIQTAVKAPATGARREDTSWSRVGQRVDELLSEFCASERAVAPPGRAQELWDHVARSLGGGKRIRPRLACLAYTSFGGASGEACAALGAAFEFLHAALLLHDDVIDRDFVRRGRPNIAGIYREEGVNRGLKPSEADHLGASVAIIAGDLLLTASFRMLERATPVRGTRDALADLFHRAIADAAAGELADVLLSRGGPGGAGSPGGDGSVEEVLEMERLKTAVYSFEAPLRAGAVLAGAGQEAVDAVGRVGTLVGVAYQVIDDVLGTFGDERQTGKPTSSDLREGKLTVLTAFARENPLVARRLDEGIEAQDGRAEHFREIIDRAGARDHALNLAHSLVTEALGEASRAELPPGLRSELTRICNHVLHRES